MSPPASSPRLRDISPDARMRIVERVVLHGTLLDFRALCRQAVPRDAAFIIFDLDRTVHLGRNLGELLGFEVCAWQAYGDAELDRLEATRGQSRFLWNWRHPLRTLWYLWLGARRWAFPGLYYLLFGKLPARVPLLRRLAFRAFGPEPIRAVQEIPQQTLLHQMAQVPLDVLRSLAWRVWRRMEPDQVVDAEDVAWLKAYCPRARLVISSASPQPMVEVAAEALGIDHVAFTSVPLANGFLMAPGWTRPGLSRGRLPKALSPPSAQHINASYAKIEALAARFPELLDAGTVAVGITDTGYGEDHCWAEYLSHVIDLNSRDPFPPIVPTESPLQEVHSAWVLTHQERVWRKAGLLVPRLGARAATSWDRRSLEARLHGVAAAIESHAVAYANRLAAATENLRRIDERITALRRRVEELVHQYNDASGKARRRIHRTLRVHWRAALRLDRARARVVRPASRIAYRVRTLLERARAELDRR